LKTPFAALLLLIGLAGCTTAPVPYARPTFSQVGLASWYGPEHQGAPTASGTRYDMHAMTAAHRSLPFSTVARVTSLGTGRSIKVRINDRGPYAKGRIIDLSAAAASAIGLRGVSPVRVEVFRSDR